MTHLSNRKGLWIIRVNVIEGFSQKLDLFRGLSMARWRQWASLCSVNVHKTAERVPLTSHSARQQWPPASACLRTTSGLDTSGHQDASREAWREPPWKRKQFRLANCRDAPRKTKKKTPCLYSVKPFRAGKKKAKNILRFTSANTLAEWDRLTAYSFYIFQSECPRLQHEARVLNNAHWDSHMH